MKTTRQKIVFCAAIIGSTLFLWDTYRYIQQDHFWKSSQLPQLRLALQDATPVLNAIHRYEEETGEAPRTLHDLEQHFVSAMPSPGWPFSEDGNRQRGRWTLLIDSDWGKPRGSWILTGRLRKDFCPRCRPGEPGSYVRPRVLGGYVEYAPSGKSRIVGPGLTDIRYQERVGDWIYHHWH